MASLRWTPNAGAVPMGPLTPSTPPASLTPSMSPTPMATATPTPTAAIAPSTVSTAGAAITPITPITPIAPLPARARPAAWAGRLGRAGGRFEASIPSFLEAACLAAAIAVLLPLFDRLAPLAAGRDERFDDRGIFVAGLPEPALPETCAAYAGFAETAVASALCAAQARATRTVAPTSVPVALAARIEHAARAFAVPLRAADERAEALRRRAGEGEGELRDSADAVAAIEAEIAPYVERYRLSRSDGAGPTPLRCATSWAASALAARGAGSMPGGGSTDSTRGVGGAGSTRGVGDTDRTPGARGAPALDNRIGEQAARANVVLLLAAALDGHPATAAAASDATLPRADTDARLGCTGAIESLGASAALLADARLSTTHARKNEAMRELVGAAGTQWAAAMALGYAFVVRSRRSRRPMLGVAAALAVWAIAGWAARVPWPFAGASDFVPARADVVFASSPATFILAMGAAALVLAAIGARATRGISAIGIPRETSATHATSGISAGGTPRETSATHATSAPRNEASPVAAQSPSSRIGYAGFALATGLGWLLLIDLSLNAHAGHRYLALYHQGHLWLALLALSVLVFVRRPLARAFAWTLAVVGEAAQRAAHRLGRAGAGLALVALAAAGVLAFGFSLSHLRQLTSELGRIWLIVGAAWFFFLRAGPMTERLARAGPAGASLLRYAWPLLLVVGVLVGAMLVTQDMGPLLIAGYASGAFVAATLAMWWHHRRARVATSLTLGVFVFAGWIGAVTAALFRVGAQHDVTASRLESVAAPFASINDQLALVSWFQRATPAEGFGVGAVPWCGFSAARGCAGVPAQIHSDYTFTALVGTFGPSMAFAVSVAVAIWLHRLIRHHGRVTRGEPLLIGTRGGFGHDGQALASWIAVAWVVLTSCQLAVTVAGNLAVLPLTGVTFPFMSFGMTSLVVNTALLALCLNVDVPARRSHG